MLMANIVRLNIYRKTVRQLFFLAAAESEDETVDESHETVLSSPVRISD
jgi:hypothetical protein